MYVFRVSVLYTQVILTNKYFTQIFVHHDYILVTMKGFLLGPPKGFGITINFIFI